MVGGRPPHPAALTVLLVAGTAVAAFLVGSNERLAAPAAAAMGVVVVLVLLAAFDVFRARVTVSDGVVVLRHSLGFGRRTVRLASPEIGGVDEVRKSAVTASYADEMPDTWGNEKVRAGTYLRVGGRRAVIVRCRHHTGVRKHWSGWRPGDRQRGWDIGLDPPAFVGFQYALAAAGLLHPAPTANRRQ